MDGGRKVRKRLSFLESGATEEEEEEEEKEEKEIIRLTLLLKGQSNL